jgi:hypothetical protein
MRTVLIVVVCLFLAPFLLMAGCISTPVIFTLPFWHWHSSANDVPRQQLTVVPRTTWFDGLSDAEMDRLAAEALASERARYGIVPCGSDTPCPTK